MKRSRIKTTDPKKARRQRREWRERAARRYEERLSEENESRFRDLGTNTERQKKERERAYGPEARRRWIKSMPCLICRKAPVDQAHVPSKSGTGRKGDARFIVPLCRQHHDQLDDDLGLADFNRLHGVDLHAEAAEIEKAWKRLTTTEGGR